MPGDLSEILPICDHNELYNNIDPFQHVETFEHGEWSTQRHVYISSTKN